MPETHTFETIVFEADGQQHTAIVGPPAKPVANAMTREVDGVEYAISISLSGGFVARPVEED